MPNSLKLALKVKVEKSVQHELLMLILFWPSYSNFRKNKMQIAHDQPIERNKNINRSRLLLRCSQMHNGVLPKINAQWL